MMVMALLPISLSRRPVTCTSSAALNSRQTMLRGNRFRKQIEKEACKVNNALSYGKVLVRRESRAI